MKLRAYESLDYTFLRHWWAKRNMQVPPERILPPTGVVIEEDGLVLCIVFCYETNSNIVWLAWPTSNPDAPKEMTDKALDKAIGYLKDNAEYTGRTLFTTSGHKGLIKRLEKHGFKTGDMNVSQYIYGGM